MDVEAVQRNPRASTFPPTAPPSSNLSTKSQPTSPYWYTCGDGCDGFECKFERKQELPLKPIESLGHGSFGLVRKVESTSNGEILACKEIRWNYDKEKLEAVRKEIGTHRRLSHQHITSVVGSYTVGNSFYGILIQPDADDDLGAYLEQVANNPTLDNIDTLTCSFGCLASGLSYLHERKVKHKDIKPANILIHQGSVLLTDFGLSTDFSDTGQSTSSGPTGFSREWAAPETLELDSPRNTSADIFSLGRVFVETFTVLAGYSLQDFRDFRRATGDTSFSTNITNTITWITKISKSLGDHRREFLATVKSMLSADPQERPRAKTVWCLHGMPGYPLPPGSLDEDEEGPRKKGRVRKLLGRILTRGQNGDREVLDEGLVRVESIPSRLIMRG
ncbi:hypothetical protein GTA08_BOTSDO11836 [Neofusicoccum parvum]|uniref:Uncharacterized protein n=1 Tax=Neofusicoccum parvum TaxID=310453 RepID=A0ACB5RQ08_9PEZI|nr:hypothetical protein GTA08_BOTSDO11836 [Neofusicoccum parvum]